MYMIFKFGYISYYYWYYVTEWQTGVKDRILLQDEDMTTKNEGALRRLNTLGYYRLPDVATVSLVPRHRSLYSANSSTSNNKSSPPSKYGNSAFHPSGKELPQKFVICPQYSLVPPNCGWLRELVAGRHYSVKAIVRLAKVIAIFYPNLKLTILTLHFITISSVSCIFYFVRRLWATDGGAIANPDDMMMIWWWWWFCLAENCGSKIPSFGQWPLFAANAGQYITLNCKPLLFWFPWKRRYINIRTPDIWPFKL